MLFIGIGGGEMRLDGSVVLRAEYIGGERELKCAAFLLIQQSPRPDAADVGLRFVPVASVVNALGSSFFLSFFFSRIVAPERGYEEREREG